MPGTTLGFVAVALVGGSLVLWFRRIQRGVPSHRRAFVACWLGGAAIGILAFLQGTGYLGGIAAGIAILAGGFFSALVCVSRQEVADDALRVGERLRKFTAPDDTSRSC